MPHNSLNGLLLIRHVPSLVNCSASELAIANRSTARVTRKRHVSSIQKLPRHSQGTRVQLTTNNSCLVCKEMPFGPVLNSVSLFLCIKQRLMKWCFVLSFFDCLAKTITLDRALAMFFLPVIPVTEVCDWECI